MNALIYTRFSPRPKASLCSSCERQHERCARFCLDNNHIVGDAFHDKNVSGATLERDGFNALVNKLELLREKKNKILVVIDAPDRLARDMKVGLILRERIRGAGGIISYANGTPSGETPEEVFVDNLMLALATLERDRASYRTSRGLKRRQAAGEYFGKAPIGYMRPNGKGTKIVPCMTEREAVHYARYLFSLEWSSAAVAQRLQDKFGGLRGGFWVPRTVRKMAKKIHKWESIDEEELTPPECSTESDPSVE